VKEANERARREHEAHRAALEVWRDTYERYAETTDPHERARAREDLDDYMAAASDALDFAHCHVAAENEQGVMEYGLVRAFPLIERRDRRISAALRDGRVTRVGVIGDRDVDLSGGQAVGGQAVLDTVERALEHLEEQVSET
jgi:hypothetical protein